jgi:pseudouridine synthase
VDRPIRELDVKAMREGMTLEDGTQLLPALVSISPENTRHARVTITEGKNRQVRRMMEAFGYRVDALVRTAVGPITLKGLHEGETRTVTPVEREALLRTTGDTLLPAGRKDVFRHAQKRRRA